MKQTVMELYYRMQYVKRTGRKQAQMKVAMKAASPELLPSPANLSEADFQLFDTLTEEIVLGWVKGIVIDGYEEHVNAQIQKQIDEQISPITEATMPWAPVVEAEGE